MIFLEEHATAGFAQAKTAYEQLLRDGIGTDIELSRSHDYRRFLSAGMAILREGGSAAVHAASFQLIASVPGADPRHFERLWDGLLPAAPGSGLWH